jgi:uncharacterized protein with FMN-binding domain
MRSSTAKSLVALALTGAGSALVVGFNTTAPIVPSLPGEMSSATPSATPGSGGASATPTTGQVDPTSPSVAAVYADGTYQGAAVDEPWGTFQVQAVVSGGQLVGVELVASPQDRRSARINGVAVPILTESAIATQGATVDMVSGATWTSQSYATSLQAALDQARTPLATAG